MRYEDVVELLRMFGCGEIDGHATGEWVTASCPLTSHTHASGQDENPSFGISVNNEGHSNYNCFTCGSGSLMGLLHRMHWSVGVSKEIQNFFSDREIFTGRVIDSTVSYKDIYTPRKAILKDTPLPLEFVNKYPRLQDIQCPESAVVYRWLRDVRGISKVVADKYELRFSFHDQIVIFPIIHNGLVYELHPRHIRYKTFFRLAPDDEARYGLSKGWFGMQFHKTGHSVLLVEGEIDAMRIASLVGLNNVLALCGAMTEAKFDFVSNADEMYLGFDSDKAGASYCKKILKWHPGAKIMLLDWSMSGRNDPGALESLDEFMHVWGERFVMHRNLSGKEPEYRDKFKK